MMINTGASLVMIMVIVICEHGCCGCDDHDNGGSDQNYDDDHDNCGGDQNDDEDHDNCGGYQNYDDVLFSKLVARKPIKPSYILFVLGDLKTVPI